MPNYSPEELLPILNRVVRRYTSNESSSIPYTKAQQLLGSIMYCINGIYDGSSALPASSLSAAEAYQIGLQKRKDKIELTRQLYQQILDGYLPLDNEFCDDTILHGIPIFFERYDLEFHAQNHILTLDYPLHRHLEGLEGIDLIYEYLLCFLEEQNTLSSLPLPVINQVLKEYHPEYKTLSLNIYTVIKEHSERCKELLDDPALLSRLISQPDTSGQSAEFIDGQIMPDDKLQTAVEEIRSCRTAAEKISLIKELIHSLADLKEILNECIWPEEYTEIFSMLSPAETSVLLDEIIEKQNLWNQLSEWEEALLKHISAVSG